MTNQAKPWRMWLVLALFGAFLYFLGTNRFHQQGKPWLWFPVVFFLLIILVLLAFRRLEHRDS